jgi:hypothetical protein
VLVRIAFVMFLAFLPWSAPSSTASPRLANFDEQSPPPLSECGGSATNQGPSLDDPNVDTDPDRPIMEKASVPDGDDDGDDDGDADGGDSSDDDADGMCRSETLELWFQPEPSMFLQAALPHAFS